VKRKKKDGVRENGPKNVIVKRKREEEKKMIQTPNQVPDLQVLDQVLDRAPVVPQIVTKFIGKLS
jgi:hypothetical protein